MNTDTTPSEGTGAAAVSVCKEGRKMDGQNGIENGMKEGKKNIYFKKHHPIARTSIPKEGKRMIHRTGCELGDCLHVLRAE